MLGGLIFYIIVITGLNGWDTFSTYDDAHVLSGIGEIFIYPIYRQQTWHYEVDEQHIQ